MHDLEELGDDFTDSEDEEDDEVADGEDAAGGAGGGDEDDEDDEPANLDDVLGTLDASTGVRSVSKMRLSTRFQNHMRGVEAALATPRAGVLPF